MGAYNYTWTPEAGKLSPALFLNTPSTLKIIFAISPRKVNRDRDRLWRGFKENDTGTGAAEEDKENKLREDAASAYETGFLGDAEVYDTVTGA
ncbi:hypothetical protein BU16DRAFT_568056 [Lophium mytilinum]|uniref:Uncharacterized protein n=1 Tax=Lophium mytilinum TaxID=390894 RepID=A0A6A6Q9W0_9PEZI|nr:hypothetical protein BU16DRAFT_568056 [Lophium mytilinum]